MKPTDANRIRRWRDRARPLVVAGVAIYAAGFFLDWLFAFEFYWLMTFGGGFIVLAGACCGLLWLVDSSAAGEARSDPGGSRARHPDAGADASPAGEAPSHSGGSQVRRPDAVVDSSTSDKAQMPPDDPRN